MVLINCGGGVKLIELLQPEEHICIFVVDRYVLSLSPLPLSSLSLSLSVRPLELDNVYNQGQVPNNTSLLLNIYTSELIITFAHICC